MTDMDNNVNQQPAPDQEPQASANEAPQASANPTPSNEAPQAPVNPAPQAPIPPVYQPQPPQQKDRRGMAIAALILGIASIVLFCFWFLSFPCGIVGIILGVMSLKSSGHGMALAGIICGACGVLLGIVYIILIVAGAVAYSSMNPDSFRYY